MDSSAIKSGTAPTRQTAKRFWRLYIRILFALGVLAVVSLGWPGWPLHPLAALASRQAKEQGLELQVRSPWLRIHPDMTAQIRVESVGIGDADNSQALSLDHIGISWDLAALLGGNLTPRIISMDQMEANLVATSDGRLQFITLPATEENNSNREPFTPADLADDTLPRIGKPLKFSINRTRLHLPAGLPAQMVSTGPVELTVSRPQPSSLNIAGAFDIRVDNRPGKVGFETNLDLNRDWLGDCRFDFEAAPAADAPATQVVLRAARTNITEAASLSLKVTNCEPGTWLALLGRTDLPTVDGRFDAELEAHGDPLNLHLDRLAAKLSTGGLTITSPLLTQPLVIPGTQLELQTEDNGSRGKVAPFTTRAGPLVLSSGGIRWDTEGSTISGGGELRLEALPLLNLLTWLPSDMRSQLPFSNEEAAEISLNSSTLGLQITGDRNEGLPKIKFTASSGVTLNQAPVEILAEGDLHVSTRRVEVKITLPDFIQARWQLALLRRFPIPDLEAPLRAEFKLSGNWPDTLDEARWSIVAGEGYVVPKGTTLRWLAKPFPITSFSMTGNLRDGQKKLSIEQLDFVSGRAHFALERTELNSNQALTGPAGATNARFTLKLDHWYAADFLPLLGAELKNIVEPVAEDLAQIGIEQLETAAELGFANQPWVDPSISTLTGTQSAVVRVGAELIPAEAVWKFDPATRRIGASFQLKNLRPDRLALASLKNSPIPPAALDLMFAVNVEVSANAYAQSLDLMELKAVLNIIADNGTIKANPLLATDLPVTKLEMSASAQILPLRLEGLRVFADFDGPNLLIDDARMEFSETGTSAMHIALRRLPLDWARARVPTDWIPEELRDARVSGILSQLDLRAGFQTEAANKPAMLPTNLTLSADLENIEVVLPDCPKVTVPKLNLTGDLDLLTVMIDRATTDGIELTAFKATVGTPLAADHLATAAGTVQADLARLPALLATAGKWVTVPPELDLTGLDGNATVEFTASAPLDPEKLSTDLRARANVTVGQLVMPPALLPDSVTVGPSALVLSTEVTGEIATGKFSWRPQSLAVSTWLTGSPTLDATFSAGTSAIEMHPRIDLANTVVDAPGLGWKKSIGLPASLQTDATYTPALNGAPARLVALVTGEGLITSPLRTRITADLSDEQHTGLNLLPEISGLKLSETVMGRSTLDLDISRNTDGSTLVNLRSPKIDLTEWFTRFAPAINEWNRTPAHIPGTTSASAPTPAATTAFAPIDLPSLDLQAEIGSIVLSDTHALSGVTVAAKLRDGFPDQLKLAASTGVKSTLKLELDSAGGRHPWRFALTDLGGWLHAGAAPLVLLPASPDLPDSPLETLRTLPATFVNGDITLQGTADFRDVENTFDGSGKINGLVLEQELQFLAKIAALVKKRVILQVPFKVFDLPEFTASPTRVSIRKMRIDGPLTVTSDHLNLDFSRNEIDMGGKVLGFGFEVAGTIDNPRFYLSEKNLLIKGITQQNDFDF